MARLAPAWLRVARVISRDACGGHRGHRCARRNPRFALQASLGFLRPLHDTGHPELV